MMIALSVLYKENLYYHSFLDDEKITIGAKVDSHIHIPDLRIKLSATWSNGTATIKINDGIKSESVCVAAGTFSVVDHKEQLAVYFTEKTGMNRTITLPTDCVINVGRSSNLSSDGFKNNLLISLPYVSAFHFRLTRKNGTLSVTDLDSRNGIFLNGKKVAQAIIHDGDCLSIFTMRMTRHGDQLVIENTEGHLIVDRIEKTDNRKAAKLIPGASPVVLYRRSPRLVSNVTPEIIELEKPPQAGGPPRLNWFSILVTPILSIGLILVLYFVLGMNMAMMLISGIMGVLSAVNAVFTYNRQKRRHHEKAQLIDTKYRAYLNSVREKLEHSAKQQKECVLASNPTPQKCVSIAEYRERQLWERSVTDDDFLSIRLGIGTVPALKRASFKQPQVIISEEELEKEARFLAENSGTIKDIPVLCNFSDSNLIGIVGRRDDELLLTRNIIINLATTHSYDELKIIVFAPRSEADLWSWTRWLPHCMDQERLTRYFFLSEKDAKEALDDIHGILAQRTTEKTGFYGSAIKRHAPHFLFVCAERMILENHPIAKLLEESSIGSTVLMVYDQIGALPKECTRIIEADGKTYDRVSTEKKQEFVPDKSTWKDADKLARSLTSVYVNAEKEATKVPQSITFLEGYGVERPEQLRIADRWQKSKTYNSLSVPIAMSSGGRLVEFDIHERHHGVHGVVAGKTGSGKTEMVQSWLLSLAVNFSPQDVAFVLIDYKGTGMIKPFEGLPHLAGTISNLDVSVARNLTALESEIHRREQLLSDHIRNTTSHINALNQDYEKGFVTEKLPILIIVIDEYAEFRKQNPEFGPVIDKITQVGRSLGMFLVLMAQKPAGLVSSQAESNISFRWCLKVESEADSREMLKTSDAYNIRVPGRAYVKMSNTDVYEEVQSFWSGAPFDPEGKHSAATALISKVELNGNRIRLERAKMNERTQSRQTEISAVVSYIAEYCRENGIHSASQVWKKQLPKKLSLDCLLGASYDGHRWPETVKTAPIVGLADDPENQSQYPLALDFAQIGHTVIYGAPATGKTTLLKTMIMSLAMTRKPSETWIYLMDFGGWNLTTMGALPHVGGVANGDQAERLTKLSLMLADILQDRKKRFSEVGVGNIADYRSAAGVQIPDIVLIVDNFGPVLKMYPDLESFFSVLTNTGVNYGMYFVATATASNAIPMRLAQNIRHAITLQMNDKSDYTYLVGKRNGKLPAIVGRGYAKGEHPLEFQTALPVPGENDAEVTANIRKIASVMSERWTGVCPRPIPEMPEVVRYGSVGKDGICLGLSTDKVLPVCYDYKTQHYLLISGTEQSGKTNMLCVVGRQMKEKLHGKLYVFDVNCSMPSVGRQYADHYISTAAQTDEFFETLRPELQRRYAEKQASPEMVFEPLIFAVDDYGQFFKEISNDTAARLLAIVKIGVGLGLYLIVAGDAYDLTSLVNKGEPISLTMAKGKQSVLLGGCMNDHGAVQIKATYTQKSVELKEKEGVFVDRGGFLTIKLMYGQEV